MRRALAEAQTLLRGGAAKEAEAILARAGLIDTAHPNGLLLAGIARWRLGDAATALQRLSLATAAAPHLAPAWHWLGVVTRGTGDHPAAARCFQAAVERDAKLLEARYNLAVSLRDAGDPLRAAQVARDLWRASPIDAGAGRLFAQCVSMLASTAAEPPVRATFPLPARRPSIAFIVCSITPAKMAALRGDIERAFDGCDYRIVVVDDAASLCDGYRRGMRGVDADVLVFCHDDIRFLADDFAGVLFHALNDADVVGPLGATEVVGPAVHGAGAPWVHGRIGIVGEDGSLSCALLSLAPARVGSGKALDGVLIAVRREVAEAIGWDERRYDGWHLYDLDFSYRAATAGWRVVMEQRLLLLHGPTRKSKIEPSALPRPIPDSTTPTGHRRADSPSDSAADAPAPAVGGAAVHRRSDERTGLPALLPLVRAPAGRRVLVEVSRSGRHPDQNRSKRSPSRSLSQIVLAIHQRAPSWNSWMLLAPRLSSVGESGAGRAS